MSELMSRNLKCEYRVAKREGQDRWQIKSAPGWHIVYQCDTLEEAAKWLRARRVNISEVPVVGGLPPCAGDWPRLSEAIAA